MLLVKLLYRFNYYDDVGLSLWINRCQLHQNRCSPVHHLVQALNRFSLNMQYLRVDMEWSFQMLEENDKCDSLNGLFSFTFLKQHRYCIRSVNYSLGFERFIGTQI